MANYSLNLAHANTAHALILGLVGANKRVLEVGSSSGYLSQQFTAADCTVTAIEIDRTAAEAASQHCHRVVIGSAEDEAVLTEVAGTYDAIVCADVLEHLREPQALLTRLHPFLASDGHLIISVSNIANWRIRLGLRRGKFDYASECILDRTHLRFFTYTSASALLSGSGYRIHQFLPAATRMPRFLVRTCPSLFAAHLLFKARKRPA